jgi:class 3 adenylate cyclase
MGATPIACLALGRVVAGSAGLAIAAALLIVVAIAGLLSLYAIPVAGFTGNQRRLTKKGSELATTVPEVRELIDSEAAAFRWVITAIFPWRSDIELPAAPVPVRRTGAANRRPEIHQDVKAIESPSTGAKTNGQSNFWWALTASERATLKAVAQDRIYTKGSVLCREGQPGDHVIVIRSGVTKVSVATTGGERIIAMRGPGDLVGERAAFKEGSRSATVVAVDIVHALLVTTEDFAAFLSAHPRVVDVLEGQIYGRLIEDRGPPSPYGSTSELRPASHFSWTGQNCSILLTDITAFGARRRRDGDRREVRRVMYENLQEAFEACSVPWPACYREDRGDGVLVVVPPSTSTGSVVSALLTYLAAGLNRHNRQAEDATRFQLRVALHVGPVVSDQNGVTGEAIIHAARMLEARRLKRRLVETNADLGFVASTFVYDNVIAHDATLADPDSFQRVKFQAKESRITAWLRVVGQVDDLCSACVAVA